MRRKIGTSVVVMLLVLFLLAPLSVMAGSYELSGYMERMPFNERLDVRDINRDGGYVNIRPENPESYFANITVTTDNGRMYVFEDNMNDLDIKINKNVKYLDVSGDVVMYRGDKNIIFDLSDFRERDVIRDITDNSIGSFSRGPSNQYNKVTIPTRIGDRVRLTLPEGFTFVNSYKDIVGARDRYVSPNYIEFTATERTVSFYPEIRGKGQANVVKCVYNNEYTKDIALTKIISKKKTERSGLPDIKDSLNILDKGPKINTVATDIAKDDYGFTLNRVDISEKKSGEFEIGRTYAFSLPRESTMTFVNPGRFTTTNMSVKNVRVNSDMKTILFEVSKITSGKESSIHIEDLKIETNTVVKPGEYNLELYKVLDPGLDELNPDRIIKINGKDYGLGFIDKTNFTKIDNKTKEYGEVIYQIGKKKYLLNDEEKYLDAAPFIKNGYTMMPLRAVGETLGLKVDWISETNTATLTDANGRLLLVRSWNSTLRKDGQNIKMPTKAIVKNDRMFLPISSIAEAFDLKRDVDFRWNPNTRQVTFVLREK